MTNEEQTDESNSNVTEDYNTIQSESDLVIICRFIYDPSTDSVQLEAASDIDILDLLKCRSIFDEHINEADARFKIETLKNMQQMMVKQNAMLEGMREVLKDLVERKEVPPRSSELERKYKQVPSKILPTKNNM